MAIVPMILRSKYDPKGTDAFKKDLHDLRLTAQNVGKTLAQSLTVVGLGAAAKYTLDQTVALVALGAEAQKADQTFQNLVGTGQAYEDMMAALNEATRGQVSELEQQRIATQFLTMGIADNAEEMETLLGMAVRLGKEVRGMGAAQAAQDFAMLSANMSYARLDQFGISSGRVRQRVEELMEATEGLTKEAAFNQAVMEEGQKVLEDLGPEAKTVTDEYKDLAASIDDLKASAGGLLDTLTPGESAIGLLDDMVEVLNDAVSTLDDYIRTSQEIHEATRESEEGWGDWADSLSTATNVAQVAQGPFGLLNIAIREGTRAVINNTAEQQGWIDVIEDSTEAVEEQEKAVVSFNEVMGGMSAQLEAIKEANELINKEREKQRGLQRDSLREVIKLQEDYQAEALKNAEDFQKSVAQMQASYAKSESRALARHQRDLAKLQKDTNKDLQKAEKKHKEEEQQQDRRSKIDALADQRLFDLELQHMAEEGDSIGIRRALERREIEEEIAREKAAVEEQIAEAAQKDEIQAIKDAAEERRRQIEADYALEKKLRAEDQAERIKQEREAYNDQQNDTQQAYQEAHNDLAQKLIEDGEITKDGLAKLNVVAYQGGLDFGQAFNQGLRESLIREQEIEQIVTGRASTPTTSGSGVPAPMAQTTNQTRNITNNVYASAGGTADILDWMARQQSKFNRQQQQQTGQR